MTARPNKMVLGGQEVDIALISRPHCVLPQLWIGPENLCLSATAQHMFPISVRDQHCHIGCSFFPYLELDADRNGKANQELLDGFTQVFKEEYIDKGNAVYVHCLFGVERAPLALAYALHKTLFSNREFAKVYSFVRQQRPCALDRTHWLKGIPGLGLEKGETVMDEKKQEEKQPEQQPSDGIQKVGMKGGTMGVTISGPDKKVVHHSDPKDAEK